MENGSEKKENGGKSKKKVIIIVLLILLLLIAIVFAILYANGVFDSEEEDGGGGTVTSQPVSSAGGDAEPEPEEDSEEPGDTSEEPDVSSDDGSGEEDNDTGSAPSDTDNDTAAQDDAQNRADAAAVSDEETLRRLLKAEGRLDINVVKDIEITGEVMTVNGRKTVSGGHVLSASYDLEDDDYMLSITDGSTLEIDGIDLEGNMIAGGVTVKKGGSFSVVSGRIENMGSNAVSTAGDVELSKDTVIAHVGGSALRVREYGEAEINGGSYEDSGNILISVEEGGKLTVEGEPVFDGARTCLLTNYGDTKIYGGTFKNSDFRGVVNWRKMKIEYRGSKSDGMIEIYNTNYTEGCLESRGASTFECSDVYLHKTNGGWGIDCRNNFHIVKISNCLVDNTDGVGTPAGIGVIARGEVTIKDVTVRHAKCGIKIEEKGTVATLEDIKIEQCIGDEMNFQGVTVHGKNITIDALKNDTTTRAVMVGNNAALGHERKADTYVELTNLTIADGGNRGIITATNKTGETGENIKLKLIDSTIGATYSYGATSNYAVCAQDQSTIILENVTVKPSENPGKNQATVHTNSGGQIFIEGTTTISGSKRAVDIYGGGTITMNGGKIYDNHPEQRMLTEKEWEDLKEKWEKDGKSGTPICETGTGVVRVYEGTFVMNGGEICDNSITAHDPLYPYRFIIRVETGSAAVPNKFIMNGGSIHDNNGLNYGGAFSLNQQYSILEMNGGEIYNNTGKDGGGVNTGTKGEFTMTGGSIHNNTATNQGGGVRVGSAAVFTMTGGSIHDNTSEKHAGGVILEGKLEMQSGEIYNNKSGISGGGVYIAGTGNMNFTGGGIKNNTCVNYGGGIHIQGGTLFMDGGEISGNIAEKVGGGIMVGTNTSKAQLYGGEIGGNIARAEGNNSGDDRWKDGVLVQGTVEIKEDFHMKNDNRIYLRKASIGTEGVEIHIRGQKLDKHGKDDPLLVQTDRNIGNGVRIVVCNKPASAKALIDGGFVKYGTDAYKLVYKGDEYLYTQEVPPDMDTEGAPEVEVSAFQQLKQAVEEQSIDTPDGKLNIVVKQNIVFENVINVPDGVTVRIKDDGQQRTFTRLTGMAKNFFDVPYGSGLNLDGDIVFDGGGVADASSIIQTKGNLRAAGVTFQNNAASTYGGAIWCYGDLTIENCKFINNTVNNNGQDTNGADENRNGGAIALWEKDRNAVIKNSTFTGNKTLDNCGGAIFNRGSHLTVTACVFENNTASHQGGAIYQNSENNGSGVLEIDDSFFKGNQANTSGNGFGGGAVNALGGTVKVTNTGFEGNTCQPHDGSGGGAVSVSSTVKSAVFTANATTTTGGQAVKFTGNQANIFAGSENTPAGGAIEVKNKITLSVTGYTFEGNKSPGNGGAVNVVGGAGAVFSGCTFGADGDANQANTAATNGGAIYANGVLELKDGCKFYGNTSGTYGGAIRADGELKVSDCTFKGNKCASVKSAHGGAIALYGGAKKDVKIEGSTFTGNESLKNDGGAIFNCHAALTVTDCTFDANKAVSGGGAVFQTGEKSLDPSTVIKGSHFTGNTVQNGSGGGAVFVNAGTLQVNDTEFANNTAGGTGGGAVAVICGDGYTQPSVTFEGTGESAVFTGNSATAGNGGAIYTTEKVTKFSISGYTFNGNNVTTKDKNGGAVYASGVGTEENPLKITDCTFTANTTTKNGGALCLDAGKSHAVISGSTFGKEGDDASANSTTEANGGAIYAAGVLEVKGGSAFYVNKAATFGGAIRADGALTVNGVTFSGNKSGSGHGGALALYGGTKQTVNVTNSTFKENDSGQSAGGAIFNDRKELTVKSCTFDGNKSKAMGGAIYQADESKPENIIGVSTIITDSVFLNNKTTADGHGGGAIAIRSGDLEVTDSAFVGNETPSTKHGGGAVSIYLDGQPKPGTVTFEAIKKQVTDEYAVGFKNNKATANAGGALYVGSVANEFTVTGYTFEGNTSKVDGGAVNSTDDVKKAVFSKCTFGADSEPDKANITTVSDKAADGGAICAYGELEVKGGCKFYGNKAGGFGGAIRADGILTVTDATFTENHGGVNSGHGGAIALYRAKDHDKVEVTVTNSTFTQNKSENSNGGAIFNGGNQNLTITGSTFEGNEAKNGGAVLQKDERGTATLTVSESTFDNNKARNGNGGAILTDYVYSQNAGSYDPIKVDGCTFTGNNAKGNGGAIYAYKLTLGGSGGSFKRNTATKGKDIAINAAQGDGWLTGENLYVFESKDIAYMKS